jgi:hypothetical protein
MTGEWDFIPDGCGECYLHFAEQPHLVGALASVGIEAGKSTWEMARDYMAAWHAYGHQRQVAS